MSLSRAKLENVVTLPGGSVRARCPACAESGGDKKGVHLFIRPTSQYGCAAHPGDKAHRKRIHELASAEPLTSFPDSFFKKRWPEPIASRPICRTPRTGDFKSISHRKNRHEEPPKISDALELKRTVRSVRKPYLNDNGDLVIPFDSDPRFHWWNGGKSARRTREELRQARGAEARTSDA